MPQVLTTDDDLQETAAPVSRTTLVLSRVTLAALLLGCLLVQALLPLLFTELGGDYEETAHLPVPYAIIGIVAIAGIEVALIGLWMLVERIARGELFAARSLAILTVMQVAAGAAFVVASLAPLHLVLAINVGGPGVLPMAMAMLLFGLAMVLCGYVVKAVVTSGIAKQTELDRVI